MLLKVGEKPTWSGSWAWRKVLRFVIASLLIVTFTFVLWPKADTRHPQAFNQSNITISSDVPCNVDIEALDRLEVKKLAQYTQREIVALPSAEKLPILQNLDGPLLDARLLNKTDQERVAQSRDGCLNPIPITLQVPARPKKLDASHIDFGVATTLERLNSSLDAFTHWAGYTNCRIFALIEPDERIAEVQEKADLLGINLAVSVSQEEYNHRYFSLIGFLHDHMRAETRWSCIIDDDTFFLSMPELVRALDGYDDTKPVYLGGLSESVPQIGVFGMMAFGGAGVFFSRPLLEQLSKVYQTCQGMDMTGDRKISYCVYQYTTVKLTVDHRLRQLDLMGDASGFFESGREPPLSVHHWKSWFHADMSKLSTVSDVCGDSCLLRQWHFSDDWILTNGYSIIRHGESIDPDDPSMEQTWDVHNGAVQESYLHELGPLRMKEENKFSYKLVDSVIDGDRVRQWYIHRDKKKGDLVIELIWRAG